MNRIYFGDNLPILRSLPGESIDLIYIDPPFNTGKTQKLTQIKTVKSEDGDRVGYQGHRYKTVEIGSRAYQDAFTNEVREENVRTSSYEVLAPDASIYFLESFLRPRLEEAYRLLKPHGSLYFHIDYREAHYCKILLDNVFGRDSFLNELIWAYDYGGRSRSKWPAKHDTIFFYAKNPKKYTFNTGDIDREEYFAPQLVGKEKAARGKLPTDTWWFRYVGKKVSDTWWQTIVGTNSKERLGYPTQKPTKLLDRIIKASSFPGNMVLDFFAGSGTVGESCWTLDREFILIDNNSASMEIMAKRFSGIDGIDWIGFDPTPFQEGKREFLEEKKDETNPMPAVSADYQMLAATASYLQEEIEEKNELWKNSPFEWILQLPARKKGQLGRRLVAAWCASKGLPVSKTKDAGETLLLGENKIALKFSTLWASGKYAFQQIREDGYDYVLCFGISPFEAHCWVISRDHALKNAKKQHRAAKGAEYWVQIDPKNPPDWISDNGGSLQKAFEVLNKISKKA